LLSEAKRDAGVTNTPAGGDGGATTGGGTGAGGATDAGGADASSLLPQLANSVLDATSPADHAIRDNADRRSYLTIAPTLLVSGAFSASFTATLFNLRHQILNVSFANVAQALFVFAQTFGNATATFFDANAIRRDFAGAAW
jgi:hypothetical protein